MRHLFTLGLIGSIGFGVGACGDDPEACSSNADCDESAVCLTVAGSSSCSELCTDDESACGAEQQCSAIGVLAVSACQQALEPTEEEPLTPDDQARIACADDDECDALVAGAVCAELDGETQCTMGCAEESECDTPALAGFDVDFLTCIADEGDASRDVCLPDAACIEDASGCVAE